MAAPLTLLQVTPELNAGGVERTTIEIAEAVKAEGGTALVASHGGRLEDELARAGGELIRLPVHEKSLVALLANRDRLTHLIRSRGVQIVHARSRAPAWSALMAARRTGTPFVTTYHGIYNEGLPGKRFYNSVMARGDVVIANSHFTRAHVLRNYKLDPARVIAVPRAVDLAEFTRGPDVENRAQKIRAAWEPGARLIALVPARLTRWKGQELLIEAAARVEAKAPGRVLYILAGDAQGRHAYIATLDAAIARHGLQNTVKRAGHLADMPAALAASDFAIFPPIEAEAFGRTAIEAQAMGLPVIAVNNGGYIETVAADESGFMFESGNADALAAAIERLIGLPAEARAAMGAKGAERVRALYSKQNLQQATLEIYHTLLHNRAS